MSEPCYRVKLEKSNGYRCLCCQYTWEEEFEMVTREEILEDYLPEEYIWLHDSDNDMLSVEVYDQDDDMVAWGMAGFSRGFGKYSANLATRWQGRTLDGEAFDKVYRGRKLCEEPWEEVLRSIEVDHLKHQIKAAEAEIADWQSQIKGLERKKAHNAERLSQLLSEESS